MKTVDYHFGMSMEKDFLIPENGTVAVTDAQGTVNDRKDLVFSFSGDDDAWLFIDGQLVLDMGGIHEAVSGSINFTKGIYTVTSSVTGDVQTVPLLNIAQDIQRQLGHLTIQSGQQGQSIPLHSITWKEAAPCQTVRSNLTFLYLRNFLLPKL